MSTTKSLMMLFVVWLPLVAISRNYPVAGVLAWCVTCAAGLIMAHDWINGDDEDK